MAVSRPSVPKILAYNFVVLFVLLNLAYWTIPFFGTLSWIYKTTFLETLTRTIPRSYDIGDRAWVKQHWMELNRSPGVYRSYVGWRQDPMAGETITIEGTYRQRRTLNNPASSKKVYFFGGSTMWGWGVNDAGTIPSQFAAHTGLHAENFGEQGWVAHQSLVLLIELIQSGHRPDVVVFYDGVNDALEKCRSELPAKPLAHQQERQFEQVLRASIKPDSYSHYFAPVLAVARRLNEKLDLVSAPAWYDCDTNPQKAEAVADALLQDWMLAKRLVEAQGGKFIGLLQPVAALSKTRLDHLKLSDGVSAQFRAVYQKVQQKIAGQNAFHDLVALLDRDEYIYIDWCHLPPRGNRYVAEKIATIIAN